MNTTLAPYRKIQNQLSMTRFGRFLGASLIATLLGPWTTVNAQGDCLNELQFPEDPVIPNNFGNVTTISDFSYESEYSQISGVLAGAEYEFTLSSGGYITVRQGSFDGPVLGQGSGNITVLTTSTDDLFPHWNTNENCGEASTGVITTVQLLLNCTPPTVAVSYTEDCDLGTFTVLLDITSTGDASTLNVLVDLAGDETLTENLGVGVLELGPYPNGSQPIVTVVHTGDPLCNIPFGVLAPFSGCPIPVECADGVVVPGAFCYLNSEERTWLYESSSAGTVRLEFLEGSVAFTDEFRIYDGSDDTGVLLFEHNINNTEVLGGTIVFASSGQLFMELISDDFTSCEEGSFGVEELVWEVSCSDCELPAGTASFTTDCPSESFTVAIDITALGDASTATVVYSVDGGAPQEVINLGLGVAEIGPFPNGDSVSVILQNANNAFCQVDLGVYADDGLCPNLITCGAPAEELGYCYVPNDDRTWLYQTVGEGTLRLTFTRGTIESNNWDDLRIYDGADNTAPLLFEHTSFDAYNLGPVGSAVNNAFPFYYAVDVFATGNALFMEVSSDGSGQCGGEFPSTAYDSWEWEVVCLDCDLPAATYTVVDDCPNDQFSIVVDITGTGDGATVDIDYVVNGSEPQTVTGVGIGQAELGPFALNDTVNVVVVNVGNELCNVELGDITDTNECPVLIECGTELTEGTCYENYADLRYYYQGTGTFPLGVFFDAGQMFFGDSLIIYDGGNINAPVLYAGSDVNVTGVFRNTTNAEHRLTVRVISNAFTSCVDGFNPQPLEWRVSCLDCVPATAAFDIVQDCENAQYFVDVEITVLGSDLAPQIINSFNSETLDVTATGTYQVGPFPTGTELEVTIVNDANALCNVYSGDLVNPLCPVLYECPGPTLQETYCYTANDAQAWAYELVDGGGTSTLRLTFLRGTIERSAYDKLRIYDGPDNTSPLLFEHTGTEFFPYELGPDGSAVLSEDGIYLGVDVAATGNNLYMEMTSDGSVQCGTGTYDPWEWEVYCIDCTNPAVTFNVVADCLHRAYSTEVIVTDAGGDDGLTILNTLTGDVQSDLGVGVHTFGPYPVDSLSVFRVTNEQYEQCRVTSDTLTYTAEDCISVTCGFDNFEYCYENNEDRWYTYQAAQNQQMTIAFLQGQMLAGDRIVLYNGADETAPVLYQGINGGNFTGFAVPSANPENIITLRIQSDASGSCDDGTVSTPLSWTVGCGGVGIEEVSNGSFSIYPNPTNGLISIELSEQEFGNVQLRVLDMSGRLVMDQPMLMNGGTRNAVDMRGLQSGNYMVQLTTAKWVKTQRVQLAR